MHEMHLVENIVENVITKANEGAHKKVVRINIVLGKDSHVSNENLKFLTAIRCKETVADGAEINVKLTEGKKVFVESIDVK